MKRLFTFFAAITLTLGASAQQVPNGGFESWNDSINPVDWSTIASAYGSPYTSFARKDTSAGNYVQGTASLRLFSDSVPGQGVIVSEAGLGANSTANNLTFYSFPYTKRPDTLFFYIKYTPGAGAVVDTASLQFDLKQANDSSLFGGVGFVPLTNTVGRWEEVYIPLTGSYLPSNTNAPDSLTLIFASGNLATFPNVYGSTLWIDSVHFDASVNVTGINQVNGPVLGVNAFPNPATDHINITIQADEVGSQIQLFDMEGRMVYTGILGSTVSAIDTKSMPVGVYTIRVNSIDHLTTYNGKISLTK
jgi:hypothetical protein